MHSQTKRSHPQPTPSTSSSAADFIATHHPEKPSARAQEKDGRKWTLSIAIPGSIVLNAQSPELRGWLAGQVGSFLWNAIGNAWGCCWGSGQAKGELLVPARTWPAAGTLEDLYDG